MPKDGEIVKVGEKHYKCVASDDAGCKGCCFQGDKKCSHMPNCTGELDKDGNAIQDHIVFQEACRVCTLVEAGIREFCPEHDMGAKV